MSKTEKAVLRKVIEAYTRDVGRGVCRLDYDTMDMLDIATGDPLKLKNKDTVTGAKALPLYPSDEGKDIVRIDGLLRQNLHVQVGLPIEITKTEASPAQELTLFPLREIPPLEEKYIADALESVPVTKNDIVNVPYFGGRLEFKVKKTIPNGIVVITQVTKVNLIIEDLPDELDDYEKYITRERNKLLRDVKKQIKDSLVKKDFARIQELSSFYEKKIDDLESTWRIARHILQKKEDSDNNVS